MKALMRIVYFAILITVLSAGFSLLSAQDFQQGQDAFDRGNYQLAEKIWRERAETGDPESMFALGALLYEGPGNFEVNHVESIEWYLKAAQKGHPSAQYNLGNAYQKGLGVPQDDQQAAYWWQRAAAQGMSKAAYNLGVQYMYGRGVPMDYEEALKIFQFAAARGHIPAQKLLKAWNIPASEGMGVAEPGELTLASSEPNAGRPDEQDTGVTERPLADSKDAEQTVSDTTWLTATETDQRISTDPSDLAMVDQAMVDQAAPVEDALPAIAEESFSPAEEPDPVVMVEPLPKIAVVETEPEVFDQAVPEPDAITAGSAQSLSEAKETATVAVADVSRQISPLEAGSGAAEEPRDHYTLQLAVMSQPAGVDRFIRQYQLSGDLYGYQLVRGSRTLHGLTMGKFSTREQAIASREQLQQANRNQRGWQRPIVSSFVSQGSGEMTEITPRSMPAETAPDPFVVAEVDVADVDVAEVDVADVEVAEFEVAEAPVQKRVVEAEPELIEATEPEPETEVSAAQESAFDMLSPVTTLESETKEPSQGLYTLQMAVMSKPGGVDNFIRQYQLSGDLYGYRLQRGLKTLYGLTIGRFNTREEANVFRSQLETDRARQRGWQKPILIRFIDNGPEEMTAITAYPSPEQYAASPVVNAEPVLPVSPVEIDSDTPVKPVKTPVPDLPGEQESRVDVTTPASVPETRYPEASQDRYTLQVAVMSKPAGVDNFIKQYRLSGDLFGFRLIRGTRTLYGLTIGRFNSREEAIAFRNQLHLDKRDQRGWQMPRLRSFVDQGPEEMTAIDTEALSEQRQANTRLIAKPSSPSAAAQPQSVAPVTNPVGLAQPSAPFSELTSSESRILSLPEDRYTLQLAVMSKPSGVDKFIQQYQLSGDFYRYRLVRGSRTLYGLSIGNFNTPEDATAFRSRLERDVSNKSGWQKPALRRFLTLQDEIRKAQISD